ncbi:MAG TPA: glycosyl hydrolase 115 family protein [Bacteroidales bacterium]|nr:glycosyl hydrolase 115 family protein [Bacteroidales bacterium]
MRIIIILLAFVPQIVQSQIQISSEIKGKNNYFPIVASTSTTPILYDSSDNVLIEKSAAFLAGDIEKVTGKRPQIMSSVGSLNSDVIIVGSIGNSRYIDQLIAQKKLNIDPIKDQWERFVIETIKNPFPGVRQALVIAGSDRRGTAYGVFTISKEIGVSPWYWWADVPVKKSDQLFIKKGRMVSDGPSVKYRGIFINDEAPALRNWATEKFGGLNHKFYEKVFELLLRNKANFLWPAMWLPTMFNVDDPLNPKVADDYGIVVSTSHHEPMMRAHNEWGLFGGGAWNYETNKEKLQEFWRGGIERMGDYESVVTVGMRGDGDEAMSEGTAIDLLKTIISDQRKIIAKVTGKPARETPQVWALYKEVQDYYDKGMRVDDDITILFSDDNWGNIRYLPKKDEPERSGGYGMYYHFDYVGAPISYRWLNVTQIEKVWEQMNLAYEYGVKDLWIANVGDIKPMELPISFFLDFAWDKDAIDADDLPDYYLNWTKQQFGDYYTSEIAELLSLYTKYNSRRTPEMISANTYSVENFREADRIVEEYNELAEKSKIIFEQLPETYKYAFYQLVLSPIEMCANLNEMYVAAGKNQYYAERGAASANYYADRVKELFAKDAELTRYFHEELEDGKWNHMMSQTHMGYTYWNHPPLNAMPPVTYVQLKKPAELGYLLEYGRRPLWGWLDVEADWAFSDEMLPFDPVNNQNYYVDIINRGEEKLSYSIKSENDWIKLSSDGGTIQFDEKVYVSIDWSKAPKGRTKGEIIISGANAEYKVDVPIRNDLHAASGFVDNNGIVSIEAASYTNKYDSRDIRWTEVPNLGRTNSSMIIEPVTADRQKPGNGAPYLEYTFTIFDTTSLKVDSYLSPTLNFKKNEGLKYAIAIDDEKPQIININEGEIKQDWEYAEWWSKAVADHIRIKRSVHNTASPGIHTLKVWMVDAGIVFQKFVIDAGVLRPAYLGPPESIFVKPSH